MVRAASLLLFSVLLVPLASAAGLTAGDVDDHLNWDAYLRYLERTGGGQSGLPELELADRLTLRILDPDGDPVAFANVEIDIGQDTIHRTAGSDGLLRLFPEHDGLGDSFEVIASAPGGDDSDPVAIDLDDLPASRVIDVEVADSSSPGQRLDLMFVIDATGSMGDEMTYITAELDWIIAQVVAEHSNADLRFGLIVYRDTGDQYVVRDLGFSDSVATLRSQLSLQRADGGGDMPEAMDQALAAAVDGQWRSGATARMMFLVADAPPHARDYDRFMAAVGEAQEKGIHIYPLAASGVDGAAQYLMRSAAALTQGRYLFLTDDSGIGNSHAEPDIPCYVVTELKDLLARVIDGEMAGHRVEPDAQDVVRTVGHYQLGVCLSEPIPDEQQVDDEVPAEDETVPEGSEGGDAASGEPASGGSPGAAAASGTASAATGPAGTYASSPRGYADGYDSAPGEGAADGDGDAVDAVGDGGASDDSAETPSLGFALLVVALLGLVAMRRRLR